MRTRWMVYPLLIVSVAAIWHLKAHGIGNPGSFPVDILGDTFAYRQADVDVDLNVIFQGCAFRDCIRSVDQPVFNNAATVDYLADLDLVLSLHYRGHLRAYPIRFLDRHEIVNDEFDGEPVAITYCPLCGSGLAFLRTIDGQSTQFGVSGLLHNNDLIMYDRASNSLWQQITGTALAGPKRGMTLQSLPVTVSEWGQWKAANPSGVVLAPPFGSSMYANQPYGNYAQSDRLLFPVTRQDARLHRKKIVYGVKVEDQAIAIDADWLREKNSWSHQLKGGSLKLEMADDGGVIATFNGSPVSAHRMFWFAWYSFNPQTALIDGSGNY